jgi:hypothetical protein
MTNPDPAAPLTALDVLTGALRGTYLAVFPTADDDDWRSDAEYMLARFQEYGWTLAARATSTPAGLREALAILRNMSDELADAVLAGVKPDDISAADWDAANDAIRAALQGADR